MSEEWSGVEWSGVECDMESQTSSLVGNERQLVVHLQLTSLSGEEYQVIVDLQEFDRLDEFETAVLEQLPTIGGSSTFGCELTFVRRDTGQLLQSPVWDTLRDCNHFQIVVRQCSHCAEHKGQMRKNAKALRVQVTRKKGRCSPVLSHIRATSGTCKLKQAYTPLGKRPGSIALGF